VDPAFQKTGLGVEVTLAGLNWLSTRGVQVGVLWVEHDNLAALRTYEKIGFKEHHFDHAFRAYV
jgi:mycothiol synthase